MPISERSPRIAISFMSTRERPKTSGAPNERRRRYSYSRSRGSRKGEISSTYLTRRSSDMSAAALSSSPDKSRCQARLEIENRSEQRGVIADIEASLLREVHKLEPLRWSNWRLLADVRPWACDRQRRYIRRSHMRLPCETPGRCIEEPK